MIRRFTTARSSTNGPILIWRGPAGLREISGGFDYFPQKLVKDLDDQGKACYELNRAM